MAESEEELKSLLMQVKEESTKVGLKLNIKKTKIMASAPITSWQTDGEEMEVVTDFIFLGSKVTADGDCSQEKPESLADHCCLQVFEGSWAMHEQQDPPLSESHSSPPCSELLLLLACLLTGQAEADREKQTGTSLASPSSTVFWARTRNGRQAGHHSEKEEQFQAAVVRGSLLLLNHMHQDNTLLLQAYVKQNAQRSGNDGKQSLPATIVARIQKQLLSQLNLSPENRCCVLSCQQPPLLPPPPVLLGNRISLAPGVDRKKKFRLSLCWYMLVGYA
ncbi:Urease subunit gamma [Varanus komodoensis]|nr:Urease subunit gamma [Varanus komodoensis]